MNAVSLSELVPLGTLINIMDIGASYIETPFYQSLINLKLARLIGFESNLEECNKLKQRYGEPHEFFPYFVGDGSSMIFRETNWFATGSLFLPNKQLLELYQNLHEVTTLVKEYQVQTVALDDIQEITDVDYIKIDVQGAELLIFKNSQKLLKNVSIIQTEVSFIEYYKGQPLFSDVDEFLRSQGFQFVKFAGFGTRSLKPLMMNNDPRAGTQFVWADAIYVRDLLKLNEMTTDKLIKLAIILHDTYNFCDWVLYLLNIIDSRENTTISKRYLEMIFGES